MRLIASFLLVTLLAACNPTTTALIAGDPNGALDIAGGSGTVLRDQSGKTGFRYVFAKNHLNGLVEPTLQEKARMDYISAFVAREGICPSGWKVSEKSEVSGYLYYHGNCAG